jgi:hypothetical protein
MWMYKVKGCFLYRMNLVIPLANACQSSLKYFMGIHFVRKLLLVYSYQRRLYRAYRILPHLPLFGEPLPHPTY